MASPIRKSAAEEFSDATARYTDFKPQKGFSANSNYAPENNGLEYPTVADTWNKEQYTQNGFGIQNPQREVDERRTSRYMSRYEKRSLPKKPGSIASSAKTLQAEGRETLKDAARLAKRGPKALKIARRSIGTGTVIGKANARFQTAIAMSYTSFLNFFASFFGLLSAVFLGGIGFLTSLPAPVQAATETAVAVITYFMGYEINDVWVFFAVFWSFQILFVGAMFTLASAHLRIAGVKTTSGNMASFKIFAFGMSLAVSCLPGMPLFIPWIWSWLFVLQVYPD